MNQSWLEQKVQELGFRRSARIPWNPPTEEDFQRLEARLGGAIPSDYRVFLNRYGAVILGTSDFKVMSPIKEPCPWGNEVRPEYFYALAKDREGGLEEQIATHSSRLPQGTIPIVADAGGNQICLDVAGQFPGSVWFWDHEQRWFPADLEEAAQELGSAGDDARRLSTHDIVRGWARLHRGNEDRPPDYLGMYRIAPSFADFMRALHQVPY